MWQRALAGEQLNDELPFFANGKLWAFLDVGEEAQRRACVGHPAELRALEPAVTARASSTLYVCLAADSPAHGCGERISRGPALPSIRAPWNVGNCRESMRVPPAA